MKDPDHKKKSDKDSTTTKESKPRQKNAEDESTLDEVMGYGEKIGERPDNLRRRSEWFQKRTRG